MNLIRIIKRFLRGVLKLDLLLVWLDDSKSDVAASESVTARIDLVVNNHNIDATGNIGDDFESAPLVKRNTNRRIASCDHIRRVDDFEQPFWIALAVSTDLRADAELLIHVKQLRLARQLYPGPGSFSM
ncbi:hypothetical protein AC251_07785 [Ralstonia pseudosolanacearum]|nr:hypothetical protein AC251_07785 [Ralstonia pseudosolanacearum]